MSTSIKDFVGYNLVRKCKKGGIVFLKTNFHRDIKAKDGLRPNCRICSICKKYTKKES